jgi:surfeit locus 1 family protein
VHCIVSLQIGAYRFTPGIVGTAVTLALLYALINLGLWQLRRADEKRHLIESFAAGQHTTVDLHGDTAVKLPRYQHVRARGQYDAGRQIFLDNMPSQHGAPGYHVLTPFILATSGAVILVNRGWLALGSDRQSLPAIETDTSVHEVSGLIDELPRPGIRIGSSNNGPAGWPKVLNYPREEDLHALYGDRVLPRVLLLDAQAPSGYERVWQARFGFGPERHTGYALTWFALAVTLLIAYAAANVERRSPESHE